MKKYFGIAGIREKANKELTVKLVLKLKSGYTLG